MIVAARCTAPAWESNSCVMLVPGGGTLSDGRYELDRNSPLAELKIGGRYVFEFDRNGTRTDAGNDVPKDYTCKEPNCADFGKDFKNLPALGRHTNSVHKTNAAAVKLEDEEVFPDRICPECTGAGIKKICASPYGLRVHRNKAHGVPMVESKAVAA